MISSYILNYIIKRDLENIFLSSSTWLSRQYYLLHQLFYVAPVFDCDFESGLCTDWYQDTFDDADWTLGKGSTGSSGTGPSSDHTRGDSKWYGRLFHWFFICIPLIALIFQKPDISFMTQYPQRVCGMFLFIGNNPIRVYQVIGLVPQPRLQRNFFLIRQSVQQW